jgi:hypothetical protein
MVGGGARIYFRPRLSAGPEITYIRGQNHSHLMVTGNLTVDLLAPPGQAGARVVPFVLVGGGLFQTREQFLTGTFTSTEGAFTAGAGVRGHLADRVTLGADVRIGWELHVRVSGTVGIRLGR